MKRGHFPPRPPRFDFFDPAYIEVPWGDRIKLRDANTEAIRVYENAIKEYIREHGTKGMSQERIRICLKAEHVCAKGGLRILEWRWMRLMNREPVLHSDDFYPKKELPNYTFYPTQLACVFDCTHILCIPLNVWAAFIFPDLDNESIFQLMLTCKQLQARAHTELSVRAKQVFGPQGTPMALNANSKLGDLYVTGDELKLFHLKLRKGQSKRPFDIIKSAISTFGCIDYAKTYPSYVREQTEIKKEDTRRQKLFIESAVNRIQPIVKRIFGERYAIYWNKARGSCRFKSFRISQIGALFDRPFCKMILSNSTRLINADETHIQALNRWKPTLFEETMMDLLWNIDIWNNSAVHCSNLKCLIRVLGAETEKRGMDWLENVGKTCLSNPALCQYVCRFISLDNMCFRIVGRVEFEKGTYSTEDYQVFPEYVSQGVPKKEEFESKHKKIKTRP